jgi:hypothetical protein
MSLPVAANSVWELAAIVGIVLVPLVPITYYAWSFIGGRRSSRAADLESGRSPATPFAAISVVGTVIAVAAFTALLVVVAVRAAAA